VCLFLRQQIDNIGYFMLISNNFLILFTNFYLLIIIIKYIMIKR